MCCFFGRSSDLTPSFGRPRSLQLWSILNDKCCRTVTPGRRYTVGSAGAIFYVAGGASDDYAKVIRIFSIPIMEREKCSTRLKFPTPSQWSFQTPGTTASSFLQVRSRRWGRSCGPPRPWWVKIWVYFSISLPGCGSLSDWIVLSLPSRHPGIRWDLIPPDRRRY